MTRFLALLFILSNASAFVAPKVGYRTSVAIHSNKKGLQDEDAQQHAFAVNTLIEFEEKKRIHIGQITNVEHKKNGGARYEVEFEGRHVNVADNAVNFAIACPNSPGAANELFRDFKAAQEATEQDLRTKLDISSELLEMAWEEAEDDESHVVTPESLIELVHSHAATAVEKYMAWKLLKTDMSHVFFKDLKENGRVVAFKAKARKAVGAAKQNFRQTHGDDDLCLV